VFRNSRHRLAQSRLENCAAQAVPVVRIPRLESQESAARPGPGGLVFGSFGRVRGQVGGGPSETATYQEAAAVEGGRGGFLELDGGGPRRRGTRKSRPVLKQQDQQHNNDDNEKGTPADAPIHGFLPFRWRLGSALPSLGVHQTLVRYRPCLLSRSESAKVRGRPPAYSLPEARSRTPEKPPLRGFGIWR
jgi:hypothetical protein